MPTEYAEPDAEHEYGWHRSLPDPFAIVADATDLTIADEVDPRNALPDCYDQGNLGSCTANAIAGALQYNNILDGTDFGTPSRLFIYYSEREIEGTIGRDSGAYGHDGFRVLRGKGAPAESIWPYVVQNYKYRPSADAYTEAKEHRISRYVHPGLPATRSIAERTSVLKALLSNQQTIAFGFTVYESFESNAVANNGVVPMPQSGEKNLGGHEPLLVGYLKGYPDHGLVRNSWGPEWGLGGYFLMPWAYICDPRYADDWRSIYRPQRG